MGAVSERPEGGEAGQKVAVGPRRWYSMERCAFRGSVFPGFCFWSVGAV